MDVSGLAVSDWTALVARTGVDLDKSAREHEALVRRRQVRDGSSLLRLALVYGATRFSLRSTAAWAAQAGVARLSDVALLNRLRGAEVWLGWLLGELLSRELGVLAPLRVAGRAEGRVAGGYRLRLVDGSVIRPNSPAQARADAADRREGWRLHAAFDLADSRFSDLAVAPLGEGEALDRLPVVAGDVLVADRGFGGAPGLRAVVAQGGSFVVRRKRNARQLRTPAGRVLDAKAILRLARREAGLEAPADIDVVLPAADAKSRQTQPSQATDGDLPCRLIIARLPEDAARAAAERVARTAARKNRMPHQDGYADAQFLTILTNLPRDHISAEQICRLYRFRWQIELAFKHLKSIAEFDNLQAIEPPLVKAAIYAKLILAVLSQSLVAQAIAFSPSGRSLA